MRVFETKRTRLVNAIKKLEGLVGYWKMDEISGNAVSSAPSSLGGLPGTTNGAMAQGNTGQRGRSFLFDSINDQVDFGNIVTSASKLTIIFFWYPTENSGTDQETIIGYGNSRWYFIYGDSTTKMRFSIKSTTEKNTGNTTFTPSLNTWYMIVGAYDPAGGTNNLVIRIYRNGLQEEKAATKTGTIDASATSLRMGQDTLRSSFIGGRAQHVAVLDNVFLTEKQTSRIAHIAGFA